MLALRSKMGRKYLPKIRSYWLWQLAGTALAPVAVLVAATPGLTATFAASEGFLQLQNFSHNPYATDTVANTAAFSMISAPGDNAAAIAAADAIFVNSPGGDIPCPFSPFSSTPCLQSSAVNLAGGVGIDYFAAGASQAQVIGNFFVPQGDIFSFDFFAALNLNTSIDTPTKEMADSAISLGFLLVNNTDMPNLQILDYFHLQANLVTPGNDSFSLVKIPNIYLSNYGLVYQGEEQESITAYGQGYLSHSFSEDAHITLIEYQANHVTATARAPEPSAALGLIILGILGVGRRLLRRFF